MGKVFRSLGGSRRRATTVVALAALCGFTALVVSLNSRGDAAFPGSNGRIAYDLGDAYNTSIWSANADGTAPAQLTYGASESGPSYSADGNRIAMNRDNGVAVMNSDGTGLTQILNGSNSSSSNTEYVENYDPPGPTEPIEWVKINTWTEDWHSFWNPAFSFDGSILGVSESQGKSIFEEICAVEEKDDPACISYGYESAYYDFNYDCMGCTSHLIAVNSFTGALVGPITPPSSTTEDSGPTFSPTGQIAFNRWSPSSGSQILIINGPGAPPVPITGGPNDYSPNFSPDGSRLVFNRGGDELGLVGAGGGPVSILSVPNPPGAKWSYVDSPAFSPDGTRVTFHRTVYGSSGKIEAGVFTMGADGSGPARIINDGRDPNWQPIPPPPPPLIKASVKGKKGKVKLDKKGRGVIGTIKCGSTPCTLKVLSSLLKLPSGKKGKKGKKGKGKSKARQSQAYLSLADTSRKSKKGKKGKKRGKKKCKVKTKVPRKLAPNKQAKVRIIVRGRCLAALKKAGKAKLVTRIKVTDAVATSVVTFRKTVFAPKSKKNKKKGRKKKNR